MPTKACHSRTSTSFSKSASSTSSAAVTAVTAVEKVPASEVLLVVGANSDGLLGLCNQSLPFVDKYKPVPVPLALAQYQPVLPVSVPAS